MTAAPLLFITGAASGIGQAMALEWARRGGRLALVARRGDEMRAWVASQGWSADRAAVYVADVRDMAATTAAGRACIAAQGLPDVVIASAGISVGVDMAIEADLEVLRAVVETNNLGLAATFQPFIAPMRARGSGRLVGIASVAGFRGLPGHAAYSLSKAGVTIEQAERDIGMPASIHGAFAGAAQAYGQSMGAVPLLILAALVVVYIVLGVLYENTIHPLTILSTLPSAGIGATIALLIFGTPFSVITMIGIILLIGIVKKNGIMMVDVAIQMQRNDGMPARRAIHEAAVVRLRPIMMTTAAAVLGAVPLAIGIGQGASLRQPLGVTVVGGLLVSQVFTLYTTPVIYLFLDRLRSRLAKWSLGLPWNRRTDTRI